MENILMVAEITNWPEAFTYAVGTLAVAAVFITLIRHV